METEYNGLEELSNSLPSEGRYFDMSGLLWGEKGSQVSSDLTLCY